MIQEYRGDGTTTKQMKAAVKDAYFICVDYDLKYSKELARKLDRLDLNLVNYSWLEHRRFLGLEITGIIIDHAFIPTKYQYELLKEAKARIK